MAPEIALDKIELLTKPGATVLDPMCGSGTVVRLASEQERVGIGADLDPLAVIITRTACHGSWATNLEARADAMADRAWRLGGQLPEWIKKDTETAEFVDYWFAPEQASELVLSCDDEARDRRDDHRVSRPALNGLHHRQ